MLSVWEALALGPEALEKAGREHATVGREAYSFQKAGRPVGLRTNPQQALCLEETTLLLLWRQLSSSAV